jgi:uncharacterized Zn finger protein
MSRESAQVKARRYLTEGRLVIQRVTPTEVDASCRGDGAVWTLAFRRGRWRCDCPALSAECCHLVAARLVTAPTTRRAG